MCPTIEAPVSETVTTTPVAKKVTPKPAAPKKAPAKKAPAKKAVAKKVTPKAIHDGTTVGFEAKCKTDCRWNKTRVAFYTALRKLGQEGTAAEIAKASGGKISIGNCLNYGYRGVAAGLNKAQEFRTGDPANEQGVRGFVFVLTAKGMKLDLAKVMDQQKAKAAKE